jgi:chaperonin cofactor prefoldin
MQSVDYNSIYQAVLSSIQEYAVLAATDEEKLINEILKSNDEFKNKSVQRYERTIRESNNRIKEIDRLLQNLYEDKVAGDIPADVFKRMSKTYAEEQAQLVADVELLKNEIDECKRLEKDMTGWINRIKECLAINNLTRAIVVELIDRIEVSEVYDVNGEKCLDINISYKFNQKTLDLDIKNRAN